MLHYFAIDSAEAWDGILRVLLPKVRFPDAVVRRAVALKILDDCHIAPSHRRFPHPLWLDSMCLIADLGGGFGPAFEQQVALRGFSAGSFSGLCLLHILWPMAGVVARGILGAIACPPDLLTMGPAKEEDSLHLVHYQSDELCNWRPSREQLESSGVTKCCTSFTYIMNESVPIKDILALVSMGMPTGLVWIYQKGYFNLASSCSSVQKQHQQQNATKHRCG